MLCILTHDERPHLFLSHRVVAFPVYLRLRNTASHRKTTQQAQQLWNNHEDVLRIKMGMFKDFIVKHLGKSEDAKALYNFLQENG